MGAFQFVRAYEMRSADFQSAVSQTCSLLAARKRETQELGTAADCKSAIQEIENLRYKLASLDTAGRQLPCFLKNRRGLAQPKLARAICADIESEVTLKQ